MLYQVIYIVEILSIIKCIHCVYGERVKVNSKLLLMMFVFYLSMNVANIFPTEIEWAFFMYFTLEIYCLYAFKRSFKAHIINYTLFLIILTIVEFICSMAMAFAIKDNILLRTMCAGFLAMAVCMILLPCLDLHKLSAWAVKKNIIFYFSLLYICIFVGMMIVQFKMFGGFSAEIFVLGVPLVIFILLISGQWAKYQNFYEQKERELMLYADSKEKNSDLIAKIRLRQHEINNHITAILAMHYTQGTYEELVRAQKEYCEHIKADDKYNSLLPLTSSVLAGFLYDKFKRIEGMGIKVDCNITVKECNAFIPEYYLVEILGILLDNASEAVAQCDLPQKIQVVIQEKENGYTYIVRNPYPYVTYDEMEKWFQYEKSSKGSGRGLGLFHLKGICQEWNSTVRCSNLEHDNLNWIEFVIETGRKN